MRSILILLAFALMSQWIFFNMSDWKGNMYVYDTDGYYMYLPAVFIHHDIGRMNFHEKLRQRYPMSKDENYVFEQPTGRRTNMYGVGTALFELPLFLVAYAWADNVAGYHADGYDAPFQVAGYFSTLLWVLAGLWLLRRFLLMYFTDGVTALVLLCLMFGTNLYTYTALNPGMSHPYVFFIYAALLYNMQRWYATNSKGAFYLLALLLGLAVITRPAAGIAVVLVGLWGVYNKETLLARMRFFALRRGRWLAAAGIFMLVALLQMSYWKYTAGHWIYFSYRNDGFDFLHPKIWAGLLSYRKGWLVYTPMVVAGLAGVVLLWRHARQHAPALTLFLLLTLYVTFSWRNWWYGGGFGCRALVDILPVLAYPLAALTAWVWTRRQKVVKATMLVFYGGCVALNCFQSYQYVCGVLDGERMTGAYYRAILGKTEVDPATRVLLMSDTEYYDEVRERFSR